MDQGSRALAAAALVCVLSLLLAGCPGRARRGEDEALAQPIAPAAPAPGSAPVVPPPAPQRPPAPPRENRLSPATQSLVSQARTALNRGDPQAASSTLDRALRIEPSNPLLWVELGKVRLAEADSHQAETCARKALALASGDAGAQRQAGKVLADALRAQGRNQDAHDVETRPYMR